MKVEIKTNNLNKSLIIEWKVIDTGKKVTKDESYAFSKIGFRYIKRCYKSVVTSGFLSNIFLYMFFLFFIPGGFLLDTHKPLISIFLFLHAGLCGIFSMIISVYKKIDSPPNIEQNTNQNNS